jgi:hypothetical protein
MNSLHLIPSNMIYLNSKTRIQIYRPFSNLFQLVIGFLIYQKGKYELWQHWPQKFSLIKMDLTCRLQIPQNSGLVTRIL